MNSSIPTEAKVVIVGGGVVGCSIAYHLTAMGCTDVLLKPVPEFNRVR